MAPPVACVWTIHKELDQAQVVKESSETHAARPLAAVNLV